MPSPWRDNEVPDDVKKALKAVINKLCQRESDAKYKPKRKGKKKSKKAPMAEEPAARGTNQRMSCALYCPYAANQCFSALLH